jgi:hypothetical protein
MIYDAADSAVLHGRAYTVDSREAFELLADDDLEGLQDLDGYGVLTWIEASAPHEIRIAKLSADAEIVVVRLAEGGIVYASTDAILGAALKFAKLTPHAVYELSEVGRVYAVRANGVFVTPRTGVKLADPWESWSDLRDDDPTPSSWDRRAFAAWMAEEELTDR